LQAETHSGRFEELILPHLDAAYNLARWLVRNGTDAEDLVQEAYLRAWKGFSGFRGGDGRGWLLTIVRNTCYTWLRANRRHELAVEFDEHVHSGDGELPDAERLVAESAGRQTLEKALQELPTEFREVIVLRELEELSYKEIADIAGVPVGTVMSRLARARSRLQLCVAPQPRKEA
jgi:RNA polymerase sigma-70 factor, ECF subfamily